MLTINKVIEETKLTVELEGRLDTVTAVDLEKELQESLTEEITDLELNLGSLEYISSAGLRVLLAAQKIMTKQGEMKVTNVNETVMEIFDVTGFSDILTIE